MKKTLLLLILTVFLTACSSDDDGGSSSNSNSSINPPEWIQGTWLQEAGLDLGVEVGYIFRNDDFCISGLPTICNKESISAWNLAGGYTNVTEEISNDYYFLEITKSSQIVTYEFEKISENQIFSTSIPPSGTGPAYTTYIKQ